ncbi:MAG: ribonuclease P protein subunit [Candidatus Poseidoniales archaeon]|jgi:RNase P/RNase MRP subunit p29|tara:strand:+ start:161 stop:424 length:264 start_codon:yes stop_codon:yes gene_type:complete
MVADTYHQPWIGRNLQVASSTDSTLVGRSGLVIDETRETITLSEGDSQIVLGKKSINFQIDGDESIIVGGLVRQRSEDRINRNHKME